MGLRVALFAFGFNALCWVSRLTLGAYLARHAGPAAGLVACLVAPAALLALGARLAPSLRGALVAVSAASLALTGFVAGP